MSAQFTAGEPVVAQTTLSEWLDGEDFYNLMQLYRHADVVDQSRVVDKFEAVKSAIKVQAALAGSKK